MRIKDGDYESIRVKPGKYQPDIICGKCKEFSGHTNSSIMGIRVTEVKKLYCQNCGEVTIKIFPTGYNLPK